MLVVSLAVLGFTIAFIGKMRPFNSDDLYWQQVVRTWAPFSGDTLYFGTKDIFVALGPFFSVMEHLFSPSRRLLIIETLMLTLGSFTMFYCATLYFLRKLQIRPTYVVLLPFVWLASFGYPLVQNYLNSDWRTFQIGFSFATFALVAAICNRDLKPLRTAWSKVLMAATIFVTGLLVYGDPYYTFFTVGPILLFCGGLFLVKKIDRTQLLVIYGGAALSLVVSKLLAFLYGLAGVHIVMSTPSVFVNFDDIIKNVIASLHGLLIIFGADFFGRDVVSLVTFGFMMNAALLAFILWWTLRQSKLAHKTEAARASLAQLWVAFLAGTMAFIFLVYTSSSLASVSNYRFYISFVYCGIALLVIVLGSLKHSGLRLGIAALLVVATVFNIGYTIWGTKNTQPEIITNKGNWLNYALISEIKGEGLIKGYASYWQANVNTYLADSRVAFLPSLCSAEGQTSQFRWLIDGGQFDRQASKSFYLIDPDIPAPPICTRKQLEAQFGLPEKVFEVAGKTILVFDYDITSKMP